MFMINQKNPFELLCTKDIIAILDGDIDFGDYELDDDRIIKLQLPYRTGPDLCSISTQFGNPVTYNNENEIALYNLETIVGIM